MKVMNSDNDTKELPDGTVVCVSHELEECDICMMDFTLPNDLQRRRISLGRDLTDEETQMMMDNFFKDLHVSKSVCILDGRDGWPRSSKKLRCPCHEVVYCSKECQSHHFEIHKMTCKVYLEKMERKRQAKEAEALRAAAIPPVAGEIKEVD